MAKKTKTTTVEEIEETPPVEETPLDYVKDIKDKDFKEVAEEEVKEEPKEEVKEEVKPEEETETVEFDPEQLKKDAAAEARKEILSALAGNTEEKTQENIDDYQKFQQGIWEKEKRQPTWTEAADFIKDKAKAELKAEQDEAKKAEETKTEEAKKTEQSNLEATNKYVEDTLNELYTAEKLPRIENKDNPDDYGVRSRTALYNTIIKVNGDRIAEGKSPKTIKEIFYEDFKLPSRQVAGADAPTNMGRGGYTPDDKEVIDYNKDIKGKGFREILMSPFKDRG